VPYFPVKVANHTIVNTKNIIILSLCIFVIFNEGSRMETTEIKTNDELFLLNIPLPESYADDSNNGKSGAS
jgi:hypothetical protein